jgi:hypothetical protein
MNAPRWRGFLLTVAPLLLARDAHAGDVEVAPFVGVQFGDAIGTALDYGATVDIAILPSWRVELLYSRQETELASERRDAGFDLKVERYLAGIQEEKSAGRARLFGTLLVGLTRFAPGFAGYDADEGFTLGLSLGVKSSQSKRFGLRGEARGFFVSFASGGGVLCRNGACLFRYSASGLWQGDVTAAVVMAF